jgi:hypothetical protein
LVKPGAIKVKRSLCSGGFKAPGAVERYQRTLRFLVTIAGRFNGNHWCYFLDFSKDVSLA